MSRRIIPLSEYHRLPREAQTSDLYQRLFEVVCNNATLGLFIMDEYQQCVYMNPAAETLTGYCLAETRGRTLHDIIHHTRPDGCPYPLCECPIDQAFPQNNQEQGEEVFIHKDGHFYPVAYTASPIREGDRVIGTIIEVRDITQEKVAEQAQQEALAREQALRAEAENAQRQITHLLEHMSDAFVRLDRDWRIIYQNAEAERLNRKPRSEVLGKSHWEEWPAARGTLVEEQYHRAMAEQVTVHFEHHYDDPPNYDIWLEIHAYPSDDGLGIFYRDISDRKRAEAEIQQLNQRLTHRVNELQTLFELLPLGVAIAEDPACETIRINAHLSKLTRLSGEIKTAPNLAASERPAYRLLRGGEEVALADLPMRYAAIHNREVRDEVLDLIHPDGTVIKLLCYASPLLDEQGKVRSVIGAFVNITEYIQTEIALRESQALFEAFMRYSPTAAYIKDANGRYLYVNPLNEKICHRPSSEWLGKTDFELFPFEQAQQWQQHDLTALATGQAIEVEETLTQADGEHFFVSFKFPIPQPSGRQLLGGFSLDVTERRRAESRLRESMAILNTVNQATPTLIYVKDRQGRLLMANSATARWLGQSTTDVIGLTEWDYLNSTEADQIKQNDQQVIETGEVSLFEETVTLPAGTRTFLSTKSPYRDEHGSVIGLIGVSTDITDRKQTERELQRLLASERHYVNQLQGLMTAALAINSALSVEQVLQVITDQAAAIVGAHQSVASMTLNQNWEQSINAICLSDKYAGWREYNEKPDGSGIYACVCHTNHPMRMTQAELEAHPRWQGFGQAASQHPPMRGWLAAPMMGRDGRNIGLIQLSDKYDGDFTEADEAILVQLAQMASVAVENARLYEAEQQARSIAETAREEAQAANRIKDEFLAVLSHELRSPLNPILGWAKLLQMGRLDESRTKQALATIERNAKLQAELIEDLLDVSRILQGKLRLTVGAVDLASTIQAAIETIRLAAEVKFIQIEVDLSPEVGCVSGDSTRLQQVVWNLLSNAVKFTPAEGRVRVSLAAVDHQAQITVTDTGKGISREFLPHVFEYFRQADSATTRQFGGLGLGLAIVRHLVELHGGTIHAESAGEGQGATFVVQLPFMPLQPVGRQQSLLSESSANLQGLLVLVVDDEVDTRELMAFLLEQAGARVIKATSAREALTRLAQFSPDILLSDIGMPDMDGYALMRQIRTLPPEQGGTIPAIALTAYAGEVDQRQAGSAGFQQHIAKPIDPETLVQTIAALLQQGISDRP